MIIIEYYFLIFTIIIK